MAKKVFHKNVLRLIKSTKGRFFSLSAIVSIGVAFFIGVSASAPMMAASVDYYDDSYDLKDFTIYSNYGFKEDDIDALKKVDSVSAVEPGYFVDEIATSSEGTQLVRIHSYDSTHTINRFKLVEGRMPQNDHEVVAEQNGNIKFGFEIGDTVKLSLPDGSRSGILPIQEVTVVGVIDTPLYLNMSKETSTLDNLPINSYLYIPSTAFDSSNYLEINILTEDGKKLSSFSASYETYIADVKQKIEALAMTQQTATARKIKEDAMTEYNDGMQKYIDGTKQYQDALDTYQKEIADAQQKLSESRADVAAGEVEIASAKENLVSAQNALNTEKLNRQAEIDNQQEIINQNRATLQSSQHALNSQKATLEQNENNLLAALASIPDAITLYQTEIQFRQGIAQYGISPTTPVSLLIMFRADLRQLCDAMFPEGYTGKTIGDLQDALDDHLQEIDQNFSLTASTKEDRLLELQNLQTQYTNDLATVQNALTVTIPASQQQITDGLAAVDQGQQQLNQLMKNPGTGTRGKIGIPMVLNMYELLPFWHAFFTNLGFQVVVSPFSNRKLYQAGQGSIPSDTVCFPAKLTHGHIMALLKKDVDAIFYPCMSYNIDEGLGDNHYNCPVVAYYPEVLAGNIRELENTKFIYEYLNLEQRKDFVRLMPKIMQKYYPDLKTADIQNAIESAYTAYRKHMEDTRKEAERMITEARNEGKRIIVLAGRPYHIDPEVNHGIDKLIIQHGACVITEDSISNLVQKFDTSVLNQWSYHSRLYAAAKYCINHADMDLIQLVSFGCGLDAVTSDETKEILQEGNKLYTQLKIDEITNLGAVNIRIRSLFAALDERKEQA